MGDAHLTHDTTPSQAVDMERFRLRRFVEDLRGTDELEIRDQPTSLLEVAALLEGNPRAVLFRSIGPEKAELLGNITSSRSRFARAFGVESKDLAREIQKRLRNPPQVVDIPGSQAPVQEVVLTGDDADFTRMPVNLQHACDGGLYISAGLDYALDAKTGWTNLGARRLMVRGRREAGIDLVAPSDLRAIYEASVARGEPLPVSFVVGCHPIDHIAATLRVPVDELGLVSMLRGAPVPVVKCVTNDVRVPADAEWVLEGYLDARGHAEPEGPYGELLGYYGGVKHNPVFHLTAVTRRRDALFQTSTIGGRLMSHTDTAQISALRTEVMIWRALETAVREPVAVYATTSSGGSFHVRIAIRQRVPGEGRNAIHAAFGALANIKNVFVVDADIDISSDQQMDWAMATRFQGDRDIVVASDMRALPLDPSLEGQRMTAKTGFDMTWPFGMGDRIETRVPAPPNWQTQRFETVQAALENGPKYFGELMSAVGSTDGREVVIALDALRSQPGIGRDAQGRYTIVDKQ